MRTPKRPLRRSKRPFGTRPGGAAKPEARPVRPRVPGTTDSGPRRTLTSDLKILRARRPKI